MVEYQHHRGREGPSSLVLTSDSLRPGFSGDSKLTPESNWEVWDLWRSVVGRNPVNIDTHYVNPIISAQSYTLGVHGSGERYEVHTVLQDDASTVEFVLLKENGTYWSGSFEEIMTNRDLFPLLEHLRQLDETFNSRTETVATLDGERISFYPMSLDEPLVID